MAAPLEQYTRGTSCAVGMPIAPGPMADWTDRSFCFAQLLSNWTGHSIQRHLSTLPKVNSTRLVITPLLLVSTQASFLAVCDNANAVYLPA